MSGQIQYGPAELATSVETRLPVPLEERCHFTTAVRFGRRKTDQVGHLRLTSAWLQFRGTVEMRVNWGEVLRAEHTNNQVVVSLHGTRRLLCFCCQTPEDAARAAVVANHLATMAQAEPLQPA